MKKLKITLTKQDAQDILSEIGKGREGLYDTWTFPEATIELHLECE